LRYRRPAQTLGTHARLNAPIVGDRIVEYLRRDHFDGVPLAVEGLSRWQK